MSETRTTRTTLCFRAPFMLASLGELLPAGSYEVDTEEERIPGIERAAYVRVATLLRVQSTGKVETMTVDPAELKAALAQDAHAGGGEDVHHRTG